MLKERYTETDKPVRYSRSPIKLRTQYKHVYLTTPSRLSVSLQRIYEDDEAIDTSMPGAERMYDRSRGDVSCGKIRYFYNYACDILKFVYFFSAVKSILRLEDEDIPVPQT